jgi:hypothetical protein
MVMILSAGNLVAQKVVEGRVESKNKTIIDCQIVASYKDKFQPYRFIETYDSKFGYKKLYPDQIKGYNIKGESYESIAFKDTKANSTIRMFAKVISKGKATLLYSPIFDNLIIDVYFFKKDGEKHYHVYRAGEIVDLGESPYKLYAFNEDQVFSSFFNWYFEDCAKISGAVKLRFYTIGDIESLFKGYNSCF